jgi:hypothetical protein
MKIKSLERQMKRDMEKTLALGFNPVITIEYQTKPPEAMNDLWQTGITWRYEDVRALIKVVSPFNVVEEKYANIAVGKTMFFIKYDLKYDFRNKKNFCVIYNHAKYPIDKIFPDVQLSDGNFLYYCLIEK